MCGFFHGASTIHVSDEAILRQTDAAIARLPATIYPVLVFTSNGSFFDSREISDELRPKLFQRIFDSGYRFLVTESRAEFITRDRLRDILDLLEDNHLIQNEKIPFSVSFGLESIDDFVLQYCINKGSSRQQYSRCMELLRELHVPFDCYVLLGKTFLSARQDIDDAVATITFAVDSGADYVFVMVNNLMPGTLNAYLEQKGRYHLPSLWRAVTLLNNLPPSYRRHVTIKGIRHAPVPPARYATTCELCENTVRDSIDLWNMTGDFNHILEIPNCACLDDYLAGELMEHCPSLQASVQEHYSLLADEFALSLPSDPCPLPQNQAGFSGEGRAPGGCCR